MSWILTQEVVERGGFEVEAYSCMQSFGGEVKKRLGIVTRTLEGGSL